MIHPSTELRLVSPHVGYGVFASQPIPKGSLVYVQDPLDIKITPQQYQRLDETSRQLAEKYSFLDAKGNRILSWDAAKFVNHSCHPNTMSTAWGFEVALRDIEPGEEITDEYSLFNLEWEVEVAEGGFLVFVLVGRLLVSLVRVFCVLGDCGPIVAFAFH